MHPSAPVALQPEIQAQFREAGRIARQAREFAISNIQVGVNQRALLDEVEALIRSEGAGIAFPAQTSVNACAAHACPPPGSDPVYQAEDVVKVDIGVEVNGYVADNAATKYLGEDPHLHKLVGASKAGLDAAMATIGPGVSVHQISTALEAALKAEGLAPVPTLPGPGAARWCVHTSPQIPAVADSRDTVRLQPGMVVAIEPFASTSGGPVIEVGRAEVFMITREPRKMKGIDPEVWQTIANMNGLPFARCTFPASQRGEALETSLQRLRRTGCLMSFPPLTDPDPAVRISQHEHTSIILEDGVEVITR